MRFKIRNFEKIKWLMNNIFKLIETFIVKMYDLNLLIPLAISLLIFLPVLTGIFYIGWDTFYASSIHFLYACDIWNSYFEIPRWNPFVLSGIPVLTNFLTSSIWGPIDLLLILFSSFVNSFLLSQFLVYIPILIFCWSMYNFSNFFLSKAKSSVIVGISAPLLLIPVLGQISFLYSHSFFMLLFYFYGELIFFNKKNSFFVVGSKSFLLSSIFIKGYFYLNVMSFVFFFIFMIFFLFNKKNIIKNIYLLFFFIIIPVVFYLVFYMEGLVAWKLQYKEFYGDLITIEPRMRAISIRDRSGFSSFFETFFSLFVKDKKSWNFTLLYWLPLIPFGIYYIFLKKINKKIVLYGVVLVTIGVFLSTNTIVDTFILKIPMIGSFRWATYNKFYSLLILSLLVSFGFFYFLEKKNNSIKMYGFVGLGILITNMLYFIPLFFSSSKPLRVFSSSEVFRSRSVFLKNPYKSKKIYKSQILIADDVNWLFNKNPISHGYDNTVGEFYWRQKDFHFNTKNVIFPAKLMHENKFHRKEFSSDNEFVDHVIERILSIGDFFLVDKDIDISGLKIISNPHDEIVFTPKGFKIDINKKSNEKEVLVVTQNYHHALKAIVNQKEENIFQVNKAFLGIFLNKEGLNSIEVIFSPLTLKVVFFLYGILFLFVIICLYKKIISIIMKRS